MIGIANRAQQAGRAMSEGGTEAMLSLSALIGRLPTRRRYEPMLVTTLRRYYRRGAPESLLVRLAGGLSDWRHLNGRWNVDGRAVVKPVPMTIEPFDCPVHLSVAERRIALVQLADDCATAAALFPTLTVLGRCFGVSRHTIANDLDVLKTSGQLAWHLVSDGTTGVHRVPEAA